MLNLNDRVHFPKECLKPALEQGLIECTTAAVFQHVYDAYYGGGKSVYV